MLKSIADRICCEPLPFFPTPYMFEFQGGIVKDVSSFQGNEIKTSKYNFLNFLPKAMYSQYRRIANFYFLIVAVISTLPMLSIPNPELIWLVLILILSVSLIKELYEDYGRHKLDAQVNEKRQSKIWSAGEEKIVQWRDLKIGDIVQVNQGQIIPADLLLLSSSDSQGVAYIQTSTLDGQESAKVRYAFRETNNYSPVQLSLAKGSFEGQQPRPSLTDFRANLKFQGATLTIIDCGQLLFRGSRLKSTPKIYGLAIYTGHCSKMMLNGQQFTSKLSSLQEKLNILLIIMFLTQLTACLIAAGIGANWQNKHHSRHAYIGWQNNFNWGKSFINSFLVFFVECSTWIPISLIVSIEIAKGFQGYFVSSDQLMFSSWRGKKARTNTAVLSEQLGQIDYLFCDKTGTLTKNKLSFSIAVIGNNSYILDQSETNQQYYCQIFNQNLKQQLKVDFIKTALREFGINNQCPIQQYLLCLLVCNNVATVELNGKLTYEGQSPDQLALVNMAASFGLKLLKRDRTGIEVQIFGQKLRIGIPIVFPFTSQRKRMSVIISIGSNYILLAKGADSQILSRAPCKPQGLTLILSNLARQGLRTLLLAGRSIRKQVVQKFLETQKSSPLTDRQKILSEGSLQFQSQWSILGVSALLDQLQQGVTETLKDMLSAGIRSWMLTGDKLQTAVEVGKNCGLISVDSKLIYLKQGQQGLSKAKQDLQLHLGPASLIIEGEILGRHCSDENLQRNLAQLTLRFSSVICCRMLPSQKSKAVSMVRRHLSKICLAIGDGGNDVSMIKEANVGVGLYGQQGMTAVQASDYALPEFRMLWRLIFVHGRWNYLRISRLILYFCFKSVLITVPRFIHIFYNGYSSEPVYDTYHSAIYNVAFTALPLLLSALLDQDINYLVKQSPTDEQVISQQSKQIPKGYMIDAELKKKFPLIYKFGPKNKQFNTWSCIRQVSQATIIGIVSYWFVGLCLGDISVQLNGKTSTLHIQGVILYSGIVMAASVKLIISTLHWTIPLLISFIVSFAFYIAYIFIMDFFIISRPSQGSVLPSFIIPQAYLVVFFIIILVIAINNFPKISFEQQAKQIFSTSTEPVCLKKEVSNEVGSGYGDTQEHLRVPNIIKMEIEASRQS